MSAWCSANLFLNLLSVSPTYWMLIWHKIFWWFFQYFSSSSKLVLSRSTSDALLASRISLPRIGNFQCDHCGHRNYGSTVISSYDSYDSYYDNFNTGGICNMRPMTRPHSVYTDQCNYVKFSFRVSVFSFFWFTIFMFYISIINCVLYILNQPHLWHNLISYHSIIIPHEMFFA